eukprot:15366462-Ditylum_brightwellii.AAC.1
MGDLNGSIEYTNISKMLATTELYDVMRSHHSINSPKTVINGSCAIDMMLADKENKKYTLNLYHGGLNDSIRLTYWSNTGRRRYPLPVVVSSFQKHYAL